MNHEVTVDRVTGSRGHAAGWHARMFSGTRVLAGICLIFLVKFCVYAWWVTPLWEIPDESGHFSYVEDLRSGEYPTIGDARITAEVTRSWLGPEAGPPLNWIAQHPPLYYILATPAAAAAAHAGAGFEARVRSTRLVTALIGALALLGLGMFVRQTTGSNEAALASAIFVGATPMFTHLSSGVTHDPLVLCTAAWAAYWCARWLETDRPRDALLCSMFAAACMATKITGIAMAVPLFALMAFRTCFLVPRVPIRQRILVTAAIWVVMFLPICAWITRNLILFDAPLPDSRIMRAPNPKDIGFFEMMIHYPVWQNVFLNFIALVGWQGQSQGATSFVQAIGLTARYFSGVIVFLCLGSLSQAFAPLRAHPARMYALAFALLAAVLAATLPVIHDLATCSCIMLLLVAAAWVGSKLAPMLRGNPRAWLGFTSGAMVIVFALAYYYTIWSSYLEFGAVKALHGRYFYAVLPFAAYLLLKPFGNGLPSRLVLMASVVSLCVSEAFFLHHVFPMYGQV